MRVSVEVYQDLLANYKQLQDNHAELACTLFEVSAQHSDVVGALGFTEEAELSDVIERIAKLIETEGIHEGVI